MAGFPEKLCGPCALGGVFTVLLGFGLIADALDWIGDTPNTDWLKGVSGVLAIIVGGAGLTYQLTRED